MDHYVSSRRLRAQKGPDYCAYCHKTCRVSQVKVVYCRDVKLQFHRCKFCGQLIFFTAYMKATAKFMWALPWICPANFFSALGCRTFFFPNKICLDVGRAQLMPILFLSIFSRKKGWLAFTQWINCWALKAESAHIWLEPRCTQRRFSTCQYMEKGCLEA